MTQFDIEGITLGTITDEKNQIINNTIQKTIPLAKTSQAVMLNLLGKKRVISIEGINIGTGYGGANAEAKIAAFIADVEDWVNVSGTQSRRIVTDTFGNTYQCICTNFSWTRNESTPNFLIYSMLLIESGV